MRTPLLAALLTATMCSAAEDRATAARLTQAALSDQHSLDRLQHLCYRIGNRMTGSPALDSAIAFSTAEMKRIGLANVHTIPVGVPHWIRGHESAELIFPEHKKLFAIGLGGTVGTSKGGIEAEVVTVSSFAELDRLAPGTVTGRIVLYDVPFTTYGATSPYRTTGPSRAAALGAVAVLVRSVTPRSLRDPHTGALRYAAGAPRIPAAAVSVEDALWLHSMHTPRVHLELEDHEEPDVQSADVMGEIPGSELPNEIVVIGGHLDSWDVGQGAHDDGSGVMAALEALDLIKRLGLKPKRTIRVVFWTSEENSGNGGKAYAAWAAARPGEKHIAAIEMDGGAERPIGFEQAGPALDANAIAALLKPIAADKLTPGQSEADVAPLEKAGIPTLALRTTMEHYFDYHHTEADTFDKINPEDFRRCVAAFAVMAYGVADR